MKSDKRTQLVAAAAELFHQQGYASTSLAEVATRAGIAPGNVFYHFRTKEALAAAVVAEAIERVAANLAKLAQAELPLVRLTSFVTQSVGLAPMYLAYGCPLAGLVRDLGRESHELRMEVSQIHALQSSWVAAQFEAGGLSSQLATELARSVMARLHGAILLTYAQNDASILADEAMRLTDWLQENVHHKPSAKA